MGEAIPADGTILVAFIADHMDWSPERFQGEFPDPFLVELRQAKSQSRQEFDTPPAHTEDALTAAAINATDPSAQSRLLTVSKRGTMFPSKLTVGRTKNNDVFVQDAGMSKLHAFFELRDGTYTLVDASSRNGTFINARRLQGTAPAALKSGDRIQFSGLCYRFFLSADFFGELSMLLPSD